MNNNPNNLTNIILNPYALIIIILSIFSSIYNNDVFCFLSMIVILLIFSTLLLVNKNNIKSNIIKKHYLKISLIICMTSIPLLYIGGMSIFFPTISIIDSLSTILTLMLGEPLGYEPETLQFMYISTVTCITITIPFTFAFIKIFSGKDSSTVNNDLVSTNSSQKSTSPIYMRPKCIFIIGIIILLCITLFFFVLLKIPQNNKKTIDIAINLIPVATIIVGFWGAWLAFVTADTNARRSIRKQMALNRQSWINDVRKTSVLFIELCSRMQPDKPIGYADSTGQSKNKNMNDPNSFSHNQAKLSKLIYKMILLMNPNDYLYRAILNLMTEARNSALNQKDTYSSISSTVDTAVVNLIYCTTLAEVIQLQLKVEWERIKSILNSENIADDDDYWHTDAFINQMQNSISKQSFYIIKNDIDIKNYDLSGDNFKDSKILGINKRNLIIEKDMDK